MIRQRRTRIGRTMGARGVVHHGRPSSDPISDWTELSGSALRAGVARAFPRFQSDTALFWMSLRHVQRNTEISDAVCDRAAGDRDVGRLVAWLGTAGRSCSDSPLGLAVERLVLGLVRRSVRVRAAWCGEADSRPITAVEGVGGTWYVDHRAPWTLSGHRDLLAASARTRLRGVLIHALETSSPCGVLTRAAAMAAAQGCLNGRAAEDERARAVVRLAVRSALHEEHLRTVAPVLMMTEAYRLLVWHKPLFHAALVALDRADLDAVRGDGDLCARAAGRTRLL